MRQHFWFIVFLLCLFFSSDLLVTSGLWIVFDQETLRGKNELYIFDDFSQRMTKHRWKGSLKCIGNHVDPEREEQLKWAKIENENQVRRILKITKSISHGKSERNLRKKMEVLHLMEDVQKQYGWLYSLYEELREEVKKNVDIGEEDSSSSSSSNSDSESFYTPVNVRNKMFSRSSSRFSDAGLQESETSDLDDMIMKDKIKRSASLGSRSAFSDPSELGEIVRIQDEERVKDLEGQVSDLKLDVSELCVQKRLLEEQVEENSKMHKENESRIQDMQLEIGTLKDQRDEFERQLLRDEKAKMEMEIEEKTEQTSECLLQIGVLGDKLGLNEKKSAEEQEGLKVVINDLEQENEKLREKIAQLQTEQNKFKDCQDSLSLQIKSLENKHEQLLIQLEVADKMKQECFSSKFQMEKTNSDLTNQITVQKKLILELEKEKEEARRKLATNLHLVDRKVEEMAEELRKQFEDQYRIISRRIRVAEQLQVEGKEWYRKTKEAYEQANSDLKEKTQKNQVAMKSVMELTLTTNDLLTSLDSIGLKYQECSDNFLNRISKASCELHFAKHWAKRKNKALSQAKDDLECLIVQLNGKEVEILSSREKLWKSENKVRDLEKMIKNNEDSMLGLKEEKREAIRQLCVWIDYHRGRSDYYQKTLSEMNSTRRRAT